MNYMKLHAHHDANVENQLENHDEAKLISKTRLACNLSRSKTQRQSRRLK